VPRATRLRREEIVEQDGWTRTGVVIEHPWEPRQTLWYSVQLPEGWTLSQSSDALVLVPLFKAMRVGGSLQVEGELSPSLLANLEEYQQVMACWYRGRFRPVEIVPEREAEQPAGPEGALTAFSGGVDSCFTAYRHVQGLAGRQTQRLVAGVMAHGFDIPIAEDEGFKAAADKAEALLATLGLPLVRMASNVREVEHAWDDMMAAPIASCLTLLQPNSRIGLIPSSEPYHYLGPHWGTGPLIDRLLSSTSMRIVHDGAGFSRPEKIREIGEWPAAMRDLRVCWKGVHRDRNCCRCSKCALTILGFRAVGLGRPSCFPEDVSDRHIRTISWVYPPDVRQVLDAANERGVSVSWVGALRASYDRAVRHVRLATLRDVLGRRVRKAAGRAWLTNARARAQARRAPPARR
jgi:hypothetical protein